MVSSIDAKRAILERADWRCECADDACFHRYRCGRQLDWAQDATGSIIAAWQAPKVIDTFGRLGPPPRFTVAFEGDEQGAPPSLAPAIGARALCCDCHAAIAARHREPVRSAALSGVR